MEINRVCRSPKSNLRLRKIVYYILGILEVLFTFRLVLKLLEADPANTFVSFIYTVSGAFLVETKSVMEPTIIIAMIVYALIAYGAVRMIKIYGTPKDKPMR